jgi:hypothetical protein
MIQPGRCVRKALLDPGKKVNTMIAEVYVRGERHRRRFVGEQASTARYRMYGWRSNLLVMCIEIQFAVVLASGYLSLLALLPGVEVGNNAEMAMMLLSILVLSSVCEQRADCRVWWLLSL